MLISEIILDKDKQNIFLKTEEGDFILTFDKPTYFEIVLYIAQEQIKGKKKVLIDPDPENKSEENKSKGLEKILTKIKREIEDSLRPKQDGGVESLGTFLQYWRTRFRLSYEADITQRERGRKTKIKSPRHGYVSLSYADTKDLLNWETPEDKKLGDKICKELFRFGTPKNYWLGDFSETIIKIVPEEINLPDTKDIIIPRIESILGKGKFQEPNFFRSYGPQWIDFENGFVAERKETDEIIEEFKKKDIIVIKGNPSSGKSVILRHIGFKLANQSKKVYVIELKKTLPEKKEVLKLQQGYVFIDDAHLNLDYIDDIVQNLSNVKILISTRDIEERFGPICPLKITEYIKDAIGIECNNIADRIVQIFSEKRKEIPEIIRLQLTKNNLWILAWELESYEESNRIDMDAICNKVKNYVRKDLKSFGVTEAENIFLFLSVFYRWEYPIRREFIEEFADKKDIEKLIELNEINKYEENGFEYLTLHHSESAGVFLRAYIQFMGFGSKAKEKLGENWFEGLFYQYIRRFPREVIAVIYLLIDHRHLKLIEKLLKECFDAIKDGFDAEDDIRGIGICTFCIMEIIKESKFEVELDKLLDFEKLINKIEVSKDIEGIGWCIWGTALWNKEIMKRSISIAKDKIDSSDDIEEISGCIWLIAEVNEKEAQKLLDKIDFENLKNKINSEKDITKIYFCILYITQVSKVFGEKLIKSLDIQILKEKIDADEDIEQIDWFMNEISSASKKVALEFIRLLSFDKKEKLIFRVYHQKVHDPLYTLLKLYHIPKN